ncbi:MAG: ferredoxin [Firmicutes bacterium]|nr:ferredoxin [Bacillota bacterium]
MIKTMKDAERDAVLHVADLMVAAAKTAPKGSGRDTIEACVLTGEDKDKLADAMRKLGQKFNEEFIIRDAGNVDGSHCVVIIGCRSTPFGLNNCHMCGFENCGEMKKAGTNCVFNVTDLGIAVGSAISVAADHRIDNRVLYSAGKGAIEMGCLSKDVKICYGVPLGAASKSIYFDRGPGSVLF